MPRFSSRQELEAHQSSRLRELLRLLLKNNGFYRRKFSHSEALATPPNLETLRKLPFTEKRELVEDQQASLPWGTNLTFSQDVYTRLHQTSGTTGQPLSWLDTKESWQWFLDCWKAVFRQAGLLASDRVFFAFSFGPFIGFWGGFEAAQQMGALALTGGAMTTKERIEQIMHQRATVIVSTPTYALHLARVARESRLSLADGDIRFTLHAGEPGASVPHVRQRIEEGFGAPALDHAGATEIGAWAIPGDQPNSLLVLESEFIAEVIDPESLELAQPDAEGRLEGELVLTNLGRASMPVIRYRTGDLVALEHEETPDAPPVARLRGGVLGRVDDMVVVRGVNVYPSAVEDVIRELGDVDEFEVQVDRSSELVEIQILVEVSAGTESHAHAERLRERIHERLRLRIPVTPVAAGTLPRHEFKAKRWHFR